MQHAGNFLGSVVEGQQRSSYLRRVAPGEDAPLPREHDRKERSRQGNTGHLGAPCVGELDPSFVYVGK